MELSGPALVALAVAALLVGFAKTAVGGVASISVAIFAAVLPARESTGLLLPLLMVGDVLAVRAYRRHADWRILLRLFPSVGVGVLLGAVFVARVDDVVMRRTIGAVLLGLVAVHLWTRRSRPDGGSPDGGSPDGGSPDAATAGPASGVAVPDDAGGAPATRVRPPESRVRRHAVAFGFGALAGWATMVANAGGAVMSLYLLSAGLTMLGFLGTGAWFFLLVNAFKVPFSVALDLITWESLRLDAALAPAVVVGALVGRRVIRHVDERLFERLVLVFTVVAALNLIR